MDRLDHRLAYALFIASGATSLVYEVTWFRDLSLIFGASFEATSIVLASFMAGLSIGGFVFGRWAGHFDRPLRVYGLLEIAIGVFALLLPFALRLVDGVYVAVASGEGGASAGLLAVRAGMAFGLLAVPTFLMGASLPIMTRLLVREGDEFGARLSALYGANTLGAVAGTLAAGFWLMPELGVARTQFCAVAVNLLIGIFALLLDRRLKPLPVGPDLMSQDPEASLDLGEARLLRLVFWGTLVSGFASLALEVLWTRAVSVAVGSSTYSFSVMLAAFLMGIAVGSVAYSMFAPRRVSLPTQFATVCVLAGLFSFCVSNLLPALPQLAIELNLAIYQDLTRIRPLTTFVLAFVLMFIPCFFIGIAFPIANAARARLSAGFSKPVGDTMGLNTLGSIAGSLSAGFVLIPVLGLQRGTLFVSSLYVVYGAAIWAVHAWGRAGKRRIPAFGAALSLGVVAMFAPWFIAGESNRVLGTFSNNQLVQYVGSEGDVDVEEVLSKGSLRYYREGRSATVSVLEQDAFRSLSVNGKIVASDDPEDLRTQYMLAHVPILMHPDPRSVLVVGMGAGTTLGGVTAHEHLSEIALAEIEPAMLGAEPHFAEANGRPLSDSRLQVYLEDGRNFLKTTNREFDVITADPIHPWTRGSGYLYTEEYYRLVADRLREGGIACQWLPVADLTPADFKSVVATFARVFPHTMLWHSTSAILIGSEEPLGVLFEDVERRLAQPRVAGQLSQLGLHEAMAFLGELQLVDDQVRQFAGDAIINTDDNLHLEFSSPLAIGGDRQVWSVLDELHAFAPGRSPLPVGDPRGAEVARTQRAKTRTVFGVIGIRSPVPGRRAEGLRELEALVSEFPDYLPAAIALSEYLGQRSGYWLTQGQMREGVNDARRALGLNAQNAMAHRALGLAQRQLGRPEAAVESFTRARKIAPRDPRNELVLAEVLFELGQRTRADEVLEEGLRRHPTHEGLLQLLKAWRGR